MRSQECSGARFHRGVILLLTFFATSLAIAGTVRAEEPELVSVNVFVKDATSDQPIAFARLTLQYRQEAKMKRDKTISLSAKTNTQGRYKFVNIPKGTVRLMVIADQRQTYGQEIEIEQDNQLIEVRLRKPQPLL